MRIVYCLKILEMSSYSITLKTLKIGINEMRKVFFCNENVIFYLFIMKYLIQDKLIMKLIFLSGYNSFYSYCFPVLRKKSHDSLN